MISFFLIIFFVSYSRASLSLKFEELKGNGCFKNTISNSSFILFDLGDTVRMANIVTRLCNVRGIYRSIGSNNVGSSDLLVRSHDFDNVVLHLPNLALLWQRYLAVLR